MQPIGYILWTQAHITEPREKPQPSFYSSSLQSQFYILQIIIDLGFPHGNRVIKLTQVSSILFPLPHLKNLIPYILPVFTSQKSHPKDSSPLINQISRPLKDRSNNQNLSRFRCKRTFTCTKKMLQMSPCTAQPSETNISQIYHLPSPIQEVEP